MKYDDDITLRREQLPQPVEELPLTTNPTPINTEGIVIPEETVEEKWGIEGARVVAQFNLAMIKDSEPKGILYLLSDGSDGLAIGAEVEGALRTLPLYSGHMISIGRAPITEGEELQEAFTDEHISRNHMEVIRSDEGRVTVRAASDKVNPSKIVMAKSAASWQAEEEQDRYLDALPTLDKEPLTSVGLAIKPLKGEDDSLVRTDLDLFAVFDGVGNSRGGNGGAAAKLAANSLNQYMEHQEVEPHSPSDLERQLAGALRFAERQINADPNSGQTTATVARVMEYEGKKYVAWASVGDTRIYHYKASERVANLVSVDEGFKNVVTNILGHGTGDKVVRQTGYFEVVSGDRLMLCSDGITGDVKPHLMSEETIGKVLSRGQNPYEASREILELSTKPDDKTCFVANIL